MAQDGKSDQEGEAAPPQRATEADVREAEGDAQSNARLLMPPQSVGASTAILRTRLCVGYTAAQISATLCLGRVRKDGGGKDNARGHIEPRPPRRESHASVAAVSKAMEPPSKAMPPIASKANGCSSSMRQTAASGTAGGSSSGTTGIAPASLMVLPCVKETLAVTGAHP